MRIPNMYEIMEALEAGRKAGKNQEAVLAKVKDRGNVENYLKRHGAEAGQMRKLADDFLKEPLKCIPYSLYQEFDTIGRRNIYGDAVDGHYNRMCVMALSAYLFGDEAYRKDIEDVLWAVCEDYVWALTAHLGGDSLKVIEREEPILENGKIKGYAYKHRHVLDLVACCTARELAEALFLTEDFLSPIVQHRVLEEIVDRVFSQYMVFNGIHQFELARSNWSAVCGGSVGVAALYLIEDDRMLAPILQRVISDMDVFIGSYGEDCICREGVGYWNYGFYNFCYFAWLLRERTDGKLDLFKDSKVKEAAFFPAKAFLYKDYCINFSDCRVQNACDRDLYACLKTIYPDMPQITELSVPDSGQGNSYFPISLRKILWETENIGEPPAEFRERSEYYPNAGWMISCKTWKGKALSCVVKGGSNAEAHNHNDLGHFILMSGGEQLLCDLGTGEYTKDYFGPGRYEYLTTSSAGHSVPVIDGVCQKFGTEARAVVLGQKTTDVQQAGKSDDSQEHREGQDWICMELASAYPVEGLNSLKRTICIDREGYTVNLSDKYVFDKEKLQIKERFVSLLQPVKKSENEVLIRGAECQALITAKKHPVSLQIHGENFRISGGETRTAWLVDFIYELEENEELFFEIGIE